MSLLAALALAAAPPAPADLPSLLALYRELHVAPELGFAEVKTSARLADEARKAGFTVTTGVGRTGVVAVLRNGTGPTLLIRTDMDALPVVEKTGLPFASAVHAIAPDGSDTGVMHACGHDIHMASWVGVARAMAADKARWSGTLVMIGQPAEEIVGGARAMIADGLLTRFPHPDYALAFHDSASLPAGTIGWTPGYALAGVDSVDITVRGVGGHGAAPQTTKDPIVLAARIVTTLQTLASREIDPQDAVVVTVGAINGGTRNNIIPSEVKLLLTVRSYSEATRTKLLDGIARIARGEAIAAGLPDNLMPIVERTGVHAEATFNSEDFTRRIAGTLTRTFGPDRVRQTPAAMVSEDFAQYRLADPDHIQSMIFWVGGVPQAKWDAAGGDLTKLPSLHSAEWAPDAPATIATAVEAMTAAAMDVLAKR